MSHFLILFQSSICHKMKISLSICALVIAVHHLSAYNNFQGLGRLEKPCFPVFDPPSACTVTLEEAYTPPIESVSSNPKTTQPFLFTTTNPDTAEQLYPCGGGLPPNSTFDVNCPTEIFIHGYSDGVCRTAWQREMKEQLFLKGCYNVILVDWTWGNFPDIVTASLNAKVVGFQVAYVLKKIASQTGYSCLNFHVTANSYGVIVASQVGKAMQEDSCRLGRLTSLDDALPPLKYAPEEERVNPTDAVLVDCIYTNGGDCFPFNIGDPRPMCHINFYINDGIHQYSCYPYALASFMKLDLFYAFASLVYPALCHHVQSIQYYKVSINAYADDTHMIGVQCDSYEEWMEGRCERNCEKEGNCLPVGLDLPKYMNLSDISNKSKKIFYVPGSLLCPYSDHSGFTGLPLKPKRPITPAQNNNYMILS